MSILACVLAAVAAICVYACIAHVFAARHPWFRSVHLIFAALALMAAVHAAAHIGVYSAKDVGAYVAAERYSNLAGAFAMALVPWLVQGYFAAGSRWIAIVMSAFYALSGVIYEVAAVGSPSRPTPVLERIALPWGEMATIHRLPEVPVAAWIFWGVSLLLLAYVAALCAGQRQRRGSLQALAMAGSISALMLALAANMLILAGDLDSIFLGEFGFLAIVLTMMRLLSGEESYRAMIGQASVGIFVVSATGRFLDANRVGELMLARTRAELRKLSLHDVVVSAPTTAPIPRIVQALRRGDGTTVLADISSQRLSDGRTLCVALNVTETVRIETALQLLAESGPAEDSEAFVGRCAATLAQAFGASHAVVGMVDEHAGRIRILGQSPARPAADDGYPLATAPCAQLSAERRSMHVTGLAAQFPEHAPFTRFASGAYLGAAILNSAGSVTGVVEIWDETPFAVGPGSQQILETFAHRIGAELERAAADRGLRELTATLEARVAARTSELARANEELEAFSYSVSHDLRGPVRAVDAHAAMLLEEADAVLDAGARRHVDRIVQAARRMRDLINGLLQLAQLSHQPRSLQIVDLSQLASHAMELLQERDRERRVEFVCAPGVRASTDLTAINVVLTNLIENAWKYSSQVPHARIEFGVQRENDATVYFVRDNGTGFEMQYAKRLFKPFQRLHASGDYPGSGIGLATVDRLIRRLGGRVWAESAPGEGATFYFTLGS
ncbi:MAG TPA: ATP-binding protein [Steroidobacteraceae bacterium]|jgi:signal transduction histidine kinase/PAS domain-containing protein